MLTSFWPGNIKRFAFLSLLTCYFYNATTSSKIFEQKSLFSVLSDPLVMLILVNYLHVFNMVLFQFSKVLTAYYWCWSTKSKLSMHFGHQALGPTAEAEMSWNIHITVVALLRPIFNSLKSNIDVIFLYFRTRNWAQKSLKTCKGKINCTI